MLGVGVQRRRRVPIDQLAKVLAGELPRRPAAQELGSPSRTRPSPGGRAASGRPAAGHAPSPRPKAEPTTRADSRRPASPGFSSIAAFRSAAPLGIVALAKPGHAADAPELRLLRLQADRLVELARWPRRSRPCSSAFWACRKTRSACSAATAGAAAPAHATTAAAAAQHVEKFVQYRSAYVCSDEFSPSSRCLGRRVWKNFVLRRIGSLLATPAALLATERFIRAIMSLTPGQRTATPPRNARQL